MTVEVEATETTIDDLLQHVAHGDHVELLNNGARVATLTPLAAQPSTRTPEQIAQARAALARIDERAKRLGLTFDMEEFKADRDFGRR